MCFKGEYLHITGGKLDQEQGQVAVPGEQGDGKQGGQEQFK